MSNPLTTASEPTRSQTALSDVGPSRLSPNYKWWVVAMLWFICFFNYADRQAIFSVFPLLQEQFGFDKEQQGRIGAAFQVVYALTAPLAGQVGDHWSRKTVILSGLYVWSFVTGLTALCSKVWQFVLVRGAEGLGETFYFPASMSLISDYHSRKTRSRALSLHQTSVYAGTIGGGALAGWMAKEYGWDKPFIVFGVLGILLGLVLSVYIREPERDEAQRHEDQQNLGGEVETVAPAPAERVPLTEYLAEIVRNPTMLVLFLAFAGANAVAGGVFLSWTPTFLYDKFKFTLPQAALVAGLAIQIPSMAGAAMGGVLADRWSRRFAGGRVLVQALGTLLGAPFIILCAQTGDWRICILAMVLYGYCKGLYDSNIWAAMYDFIDPSRRGTTLGIGNMLGWGGSAIITWVVGWASSGKGGMSMSDAIAWSATLYVVISVLLAIAGFVLAPRDFKHSSLQPTADVVEPHHA